jgi:hypothetical protein
LLPGALADWVYRKLIGVRWGEDQLKFGLRLTGFSIFSFALYCVACLSGAPQPTYIFPALFSAIVPATLPSIAAAYLGHCAAGIVTGLLAAGATLITSRMGRFSGYPCAWDVFVRDCAANRMIAITLQNGDAYAGILKACDASVMQQERDMVLSEPAIYSEKTSDYAALPYQHLFIPAGLVYSVASIHDPERDKRMVPVGESPFKRKERKNDPGVTAPAPASA